MARDRPSPYEEGETFLHRSAGACLPRTLGSTNDGEGQALALRKSEDCSNDEWDGEGQALALR